MTPRAVRCDGEDVQTATWTLRHPRTGRAVTLVGMMHIGDSSYYRSVSRDVHALAAAGSETQYEQIRKLSEAELAALDPDERRQVEELREVLKHASTPLLADALGLSLQKSELVYDTGARNVDYTEVELFRGLGYEQARKLFDTRNLKDIEPETFRKVMRFVLRHYGTVSALGLVLPRGRAMRRVILEARNAVALGAARERLAAGDVTLVWGAAHLPGMRRELESDGYVLVGESWRTVCTL